jgi:hypothetical protein
MAPVGTFNAAVATSSQFFLFPQKMNVVDCFLLPLKNHFFCMSVLSEKKFFHEQAMIHYLILDLNRKYRFSSYSHGH